MAKVLVTSTRKMLLWLNLWGHRLGKCYCGICSGDIDLENVSVAKVLGTSILKNVAVANVLVTSSLEMLLWLTFCAFHTFRKPFELIIAVPNCHRF